LSPERGAIALKKARRKRGGGILKKVRKPVAPPARVEEARTRYRRERERERLRREEDGEET
jgi:hypothetical protein